MLVRHLLFIAFTLLLPLSAAAADLTLLNKVQAHHEAMHRRVAPAVVAVQCRTNTPGVGSYGTGVVISADGLILTSATVVPSAARSTYVFFSDGKVMEARPVSTDPVTESCVLQAILSPSEKNKPLAFVELSDSSKASIGQLAYTAGNPFHTISRDGQVAWSVGTISGQYNIASADEQSRYKGIIFETDAAVNPGSDGGPLLDSNGRLLGLLSLCFNETRWLGTSVPIHLIKKAQAPLAKLPLVDPTENPKSIDGGQPFDAEGGAAARAIPEALRSISRSVAGSLVKIHMRRKDALPANPGAAKDTLARRLRQRPDGPVTGVIIEAEGLILTSAFNIEGDVSAIEVELPGGVKLPATLLGRHMGLDVAALKIAPPAGKPLTPLPLEARPNLKIGRFITILGASEDGPVTQTTGIVSALDRLDGLATQTDALTNYGNSGGPVIDLRGRLIGIAAYVRPESSWSLQNSGVGFFSQSDRILAALADLKAGRDMKAPPRFFVEEAAELGAPELRGVKIEDVLPNSVAEQAKLQTGDVIVAVNGMDTHSWPALVRVLKAHHPGDTVDITYQRGTTTHRAQAVLQSDPNAKPSNKKGTP